MDTIDDNVAIRLKLLIQKLGVTNSIFAENCEISRATLSQLLTGRNQKISNVIINKIHEAYPQVSILWLLFNEGEMFSGGNNGNAAAGTGDSPNDEANFNSNNPDGIDYAHKYGIESSNESCENQNSFTVPQNDCKYLKENRLNSGYNDSQLSGNKNVNPSQNIPELLGEIENLKKNKRKVVQITIYYDDSTFETFIPGSK